MQNFYLNNTNIILNKKDTEYDDEYDNDDIIYDNNHNNHHYYNKINNNNKKYNIINNLDREDAQRYSGIIDGRTSPLENKKRKIKIN